MKVIVERPDYLIDERFDINWFNRERPEHLAINHIAMEKVFRTLALERSGAVAPLPMAPSGIDIDTWSFEDLLRPGHVLSGEQFLNRRLFNDALLIMHQGHVIQESYRNGMLPTDRHVIHSCTKSFVAIIVHGAIESGLMTPGAEISDYVAEFQGQDVWRGVTLQHVLDMQSGVRYSEDYEDPGADYWSYAKAAGYYPPDEGTEAMGVRNWILAHLTARDHEPGEAFVYNSCLADVLGMALETVYQKPLGQVFEEAFFVHVGAESDAYLNTDRFVFPIVEGQLNLTLRDFARCAWPLLNDGRSLTGKPLIPKRLMEDITTADPAYQKAYQRVTPDDLFPSGCYRNQFWCFRPEQRQFSMIGIHGQFAWFDLNRELMIVGFGSYPTPDSALMMHTLSTLWDTVAMNV